MCLSNHIVFKIFQEEIQNLIVNLFPLKIIDFTMNLLGPLKLKIGLLPEEISLAIFVL